MNDEVDSCKLPKRKPAMFWNSIWIHMPVKLSLAYDMQISMDFDQDGCVHLTLHDLI